MQVGRILGSHQFFSLIMLTNHRVLYLQFSDIGCWRQLVLFLECTATGPTLYGMRHQTTRFRLVQISVWFEYHVGNTVYAPIRLPISQSVTIVTCSTLLVEVYDTHSSKNWPYLSGGALETRLLILDPGVGGGGVSKSISHFVTCKNTCRYRRTRNCAYKCTQF